MYIPAKLLKCEGDSVSEGGCSLELREMQNKVHVLSMNCVKNSLNARGRTADFAILWKERPWLAMIELKGGQSLRAAQIVEQVQNGLAMIGGALEDQTVVNFFPIIVHKGKRDPRRALRGRKVSFGKEWRSIIVRECGDNLSSLT